MNSIYSNTIIAGENLIKMIQNMKNRSHVKSKTSAFNAKMTAGDVLETADSIGELFSVGIFAVGFSMIGAPFRENNRITDKKEEHLIRECRNYIWLLQNLPMPLQQNLKGQKLISYVQGDYSSISYNKKFIKDIFLDEASEKKIIMFSYMIDEIMWNNRILQNVE